MPSVYYMFQSFRWQTIILVVALTLILYGLSWLSISTLTFFTSDTGLRFLQIQSLVDQEWRSFSVDYGARYLDPDWHHVPYYYAYLIIEDELYLPLSPFFLYLSSICYALLGVSGLPLVTVAGGMLTGLAVYRLGRLSQLPYAALALTITIFATPILFYSLELWDHTFGTACALWGCYYVAKGLTKDNWRLLFLGGVITGLATGQRPELHTLAIALGLSLCLVTRFNWRMILIFGGGGLLGLLPIWGLQYMWFGHPLAPVVGKHLFDYGQPEIIPFQGTPMSMLTKNGMFLLNITLKNQKAEFILSTTLLIVGLGLTILSLRVVKWRSVWTLLGGFAALSISYLIFVSLSQTQVITGILPVFPLSILGFTYLDQKQFKTRPPVLPYRLLFFTTIIFICLMLWLWPAPGGLQWGARYLLPVYPLLVYLAWQVVIVYQSELSNLYQPIKGLRFVFQGMVLGLILLSLILQLMGVRLLYLVHYNQISVRKVLQEMPVEVILTDQPFFPSLMTSLRDKHFLYINNDDEAQKILGMLENHNIQQVGVVAQGLHSLERPATNMGLNPYLIDIFIHPLASQGRSTGEP